MVKIKKKVVLATQKIFQAKTKLSDHREQGFTLLELIITITIIAAIVTLALPRLNNKNNEMRAMVRKFSVLCRELRARAKLNNATYRLAILMEEKDSQPQHSFWVERGHGEILNDYDPKNPPSLPEEAEEKKKNDEDSAPKPFTPDTKVMKRPDVLPGSLQFESVELASLKEPVTSGLVYIHFFPSGFADEAAIHLKIGDKIKWTLNIQPLTGGLEIIPEFKRLEDLRPK